MAVLVLFSATAKFFIWAMVWILLVRSASLYIYSEIFSSVYQCVSNLRLYTNVCIFGWTTVLVQRCLYWVRPSFRWYTKVYIWLDPLLLVYQGVYLVRPSFRWYTKVYIWLDRLFVGIPMCIFG
jgi:hypothetical protein